MPKHATANDSKLARACQLPSAQLNDMLGSGKDYTPASDPSCALSTVAYHINDMPEMLLKFAVDLVESNMKELYMKSKDGWCREDKEDEMEDELSRYLITFCDNVPVAMVHFQFVEEETMTDRDAEVAYCFEIQVTPGYQRKGIGAYLIGLLESIGKQAAMDKVMLTVFKANTSAIKFYIDQLKYKYDEISPCVCLTRGRASRFDYEILSKDLL
ncbi:N-alpha-acetyltransferase 40 [Entomortierella parvispora]|uniref:N-alpha-acetyltransferase 40 n=1 Tax=Entomortierella parvispora TaxID=205924 RepID=A0A9P3H3R9_9FUNG|nr:N-alpha-acetyltransferase 40 [Entomortierella parvispora]